MYAKIWLRSYAPSAVKLAMLERMPPEVVKLTAMQKAYLKLILPFLEKAENADKLQQDLYQAAKQLDLPAKEAFGAIYISLTGKSYGPRAAWLLMQSDREAVVNRLKQAADYCLEKTVSTQKRVVMVQKPEYFSIATEIKESYPSISVGIAIIRGLTVRESDLELEKEKQYFARSQAELTNEAISAWPEIAAYRRIYREMGLDWHSRRPSPEALLRRLVQGKGMASVNTCVDAYNLAVMENRISVGAFDLAKIVFPTQLRFAGAGDQILLHGDKEPTVYTATELAYYDSQGGYNIDFNYRDAQRTLVTTSTKDVWINVDGVYEVTPEKVEKTLFDAVSRIVKYCGGQVEFTGLVV
jgi:DNA/RNA-binding domain of Phe-tRNA-synthetase-like protein